MLRNLGQAEWLPTVSQGELRHGFVKANTIGALRSLVGSSGAIFNKQGRILLYTACSYTAVGLGKIVQFLLFDGPFSPPDADPNSSWAESLWTEGSQLLALMCSEEGLEPR